MNHKSVPSMKQFTDLYWKLDETTSTNQKVKALCDYFRTADPEDAAIAVNVLSGVKQKRAVSLSLLRQWAAEVADVPSWLIEESYAHVGDLAETIALVLPPPTKDVLIKDNGLATYFRSTVHALGEAKENHKKKAIILEVWQTLTARERIVWHKLLTGGCRVGVSKTLVSRALAEIAGVDVSVMAHRLMGNTIDNAEAFSQLLLPEENDTDNCRPYPFFLASPLEGQVPSLGNVTEWQAEWKWDGIRAQLVRRGDDVSIWSRGEELLNEAFPEITDAARTLPRGTVLDGELLAVRNHQLLPFASLSRRTSRRRVTKKMLSEIPCVFVAYDLLELDVKDLREETLAKRRSLLETLVSYSFEDWIDPVQQHILKKRPDRCSLFFSPLVKGTSWEALTEARDMSRRRGVEGLMLKKKKSAYQSGRIKGDWWKWKTDPLEIDAVLLYAQAGHGRRAGLHTDYTLGVWDGDQLVPVAKAYSGLSDKEISEVEKVIRSTTTDKHGPVRVVKPTLVFQLAFDGVANSTRHKSGVAVRFPRITRWRRDKHPHEAGHLKDIKQMIELAELPRTST